MQFSITAAFPSISGGRRLFSQLGSKIARLHGHLATSRRMNDCMDRSPTWLGCLNGGNACGFTLTQAQSWMGELLKDVGLGMTGTVLMPTESIGRARTQFWSSKMSGSHQQWSQFTMPRYLPTSLARPLPSRHLPHHLPFHQLYHRSRHRHLLNCKTLLCHRQMLKTTTMTM